MSDFPPDNEAEPKTVAPEIRIDDSQQDAARRMRRSKSSFPLAALIVAGLLGGALAWGVVAIIPDSWKFRISGKSADGETAQKKSRKSDKENSDTAGQEKRSDWSATTIPDIPMRKKRKRTAADQSRDEVAAKFVKKLEQEAATMLNEAKRLLSRKQTKRAVRILEEILARFPGSRAAVEAEKLLLTVD